MGMLVNACLLALQGQGEALIPSIHPHPWHKYSRHGQCQCDVSGAETPPTGSDELAPASAGTPLGSCGMSTRYQARLHTPHAGAH